MSENKETNQALTAQEEITAGAIRQSKALGEPPIEDQLAYLTGSSFADKVRAETQVEITQALAQERDLQYALERARQHGSNLRFQADYWKERCLRAESRCCWSRGHGNDKPSEVAGRTPKTV